MESMSGHATTLAVLQIRCDLLVDCSVLGLKAGVFGLELLVCAALSWHYCRSPTCVLLGLKAHAIGAMRA